MRTSRFLIVATPFVLALASCGEWPEIVESAADVRRLPRDEMSIRARGLPDEDLGSLERLRSLQILDFAGGWGVMEAEITDRGVGILADLSLPRLRTLDLGHNDNLTDESTRHLARMEQVRQLLLTLCPGLTDEGVRSLAGMRSLRYLDLRGCAGLTDEAVDHVERMPRIERVLFDGCPGVSAEAVARLQERLPDTIVTKDDENWAFHQH